MLSEEINPLVNRWYNLKIKPFIQKWGCFRDLKWRDSYISGIDRALKGKSRVHQHWPYLKWLSIGKISHFCLIISRHTLYNYHMQRYVIKHITSTIIIWPASTKPEYNQENMYFWLQNISKMQNSKLWKDTLLQCLGKFAQSFLLENEFFLQKYILFMFSFVLWHLGSL